MKFFPEGKLIGTAENQAALRSPATLSDAMRSGRILEAKAMLCDSKHNLVVDFGFMRGIIPREEGAIGIREGTVRDIAILSRVNHPVCFIITDFVRDDNGKITAILSRRAAQEACCNTYVAALLPGDIVDVKITHIEPFGVFADIGCGVVALLPIDAISVSRIEHPRERFQTGMEIRAIIKSKENDRITLTHKELLGTWEENAAGYSPGETVPGIIRSIENYGIFVELTPNLAGLAELREGVLPSQRASVFIKSILPDRMKIKLIVIETFPQEIPVPQAPVYYYQGEHMDVFCYSPAQCKKQVLTVFDN